MQSIFGAIDEINGQLPKGKKIEKSINTALFGNGGKLDSLGLISLVTAIEQRIEEDLGMPVPILEEMEALENDNPFETIATLVDYIVFKLKKKTDE